MQYRRLFCLAAATTAGLSSGALLAQDRSAPAVPPVLKELIDCRAIADAAERLACYDQRTEAFAQAQLAGDVVVADREQIREERRGLFGLSLPRIKLFGGGGEEEISEITGTIASAREGSSGWIFTLEDGAVWVQTDSRFIRKPVAGQSIRIKRGPVGGYMANVNDGLGIRVRRTLN